MPGLLTRPFAFLVICTMLMAMFFQPFDAALWTMLPALGFVRFGRHSLVLGSGRFGLDYLLSRGRAK